MNSYIRILFCMCIAGIMACENPDQFTRNNPLDPESSLLYAPTPPSDLNITVHSDTHIEIEWEINSLAEAGFVIERKSEDDDDFRIIGSVEAGINKFTDTSGIVTDLYYYYRVGAFGEAQVQYYSDVKNILLEFPAPENITVNTYDESNITIDWDISVSFYSGFIIERKKNNQEFYEIIAVIDTGDQSYKDSDIDAENIYNYKIYAYTSINDGTSRQFSIVYGPYHFQKIFEITLEKTTHTYEFIREISADGSHFVTNGHGGGHKTAIRNGNNGNIIHSLDLSPGTHWRPIALSNDGNLLATGYGSNGIAIWSMEDYELKDTIIRFREGNEWVPPPNNCTFSNDNLYIAVDWSGGIIALYSILTKELVNSRQDTEQINFKHIYLSEDNQFILTLNYHGRIRKYSLPGLNHMGSTDAQLHSDISSINGKRIAIGINNVLRIIDFSNNAFQYIYDSSQTSFRIYSVALNSKGRYLYIGSEFGKIYVQNVDTGFTINPITLPQTGHINHFLLSSDNSFIIIQDSNGKATGFDVSEHWHIYE